MAKSSTLTLFVQLVKHVPERIIVDAVAKRQTDYRSKGVRHADALVSLLFHQLSGGGAHFTDVVNWLSKFKKAPGS